jgi:hypothetical protein
VLVGLQERVRLANGTEYVSTELHAVTVRPDHVVYHLRLQSPGPYDPREKAAIRLIAESIEFREVPSEQVPADEQAPVRGRRRQRSAPPPEIPRGVTTI